MRKTLTAVAAAATIGVATVATPTTADARWGWWGPALGAFAVGAIVGGALVPWVAGKAADTWSLKQALIVPAACYLGILLFGWFARRPVEQAA